MVVVWCNGSMLVSINEVNLHSPQLVLGWVIMSGFSFWFQTFISVCNQLPRSTQPGIPPWVGAVSTSQRVVTPCGWEVKAGMVRVCLAGKTV